ncbi:MAG: coiled-coil domain-containing protein [Gammaproteobacteria bacterium]
MKSVVDLPRVPVYVSLPDDIRRQGSAITTACIEQLGIGHRDITLWVGGADAYKFISNHYQPESFAPLCIYIHIKDNEAASIVTREQILLAALAKEPSLSNMQLLFEQSYPLSNGDFKIEMLTGKVFHPFPEVKPTHNNTQQPPYIDSRLFLYSNIIITPLLGQIINDAHLLASNTAAENNIPLKTLSNILIAYFIWITSGKLFHPDVAMLVSRLFNDAQYANLVSDLEKIHPLPPYMTFSDCIHRFKKESQDSITLSRIAQHPLIVHLESTRTSLGQVQAENSTLKEQLSHLSQETNELGVELASVREKELNSKNEAIALMKAEFEKEKAALKATLAATQTKLSEATHKNKQLTEAQKKDAQEIKRLSDINKKKEKDTTHINLKEKVVKLEAEKAALSQKNNSLNNEKIALEKDLAEAKAASAKQSASHTSTTAPAISPVTAIIEQPKKASATADGIKHIFAWYMLEMLSGGDNRAEIPELTSLFVHDNQEKRIGLKTHPKAVELAGNKYQTLKQAANAAQQLKLIYETIRKWNIESDEPETMDADVFKLIISEDAKNDSLSCSLNQFKTTEQRVNEFADLTHYLLNFVQLTDNNQTCITKLNKLLSILRGDAENVKNLTQALMSKLNRISAIHHIHVKYTELILQSIDDYEIKPGVYGSTRFRLHVKFTESRKEFLEKLQSLVCADGEYREAQLRFIETLACIKKTTKRHLTPEMLDDLNLVFITQHRYHLCKPTLEAYLNERRFKPDEAFKRMIADLVRVYPHENPPEIMSSFFISCGLWSSDDRNKKIIKGHPLLRASSQLVSENFIKNFNQPEEPAAKAEKLKTAFINARAEIHKLFPNANLETCDAVLLTIIDSVKMHFVGEQASDQASFVALTKIHTGVEILRKQKNTGASSSSSPQEKSNVNNAENATLKHLLALFLVEVIQHLLNQDPALPHKAFSSSEGSAQLSERLSKLTHPQKTAIQELAKLLPENSDQYVTNHTALRLTYILVAISSLNTEDSDQLFAGLSQHLMSLDNDREVNEGITMSDEMATARFSTIRNQFKLIHQFIHDDNITLFCNPESLRKKSPLVSGENGILKTKAADLVFKFIHIGDTHRFLVNNKYAILEAYSSHVLKQKFSAAAIDFYKDYSKVIKSVPQDMLEHAEQYFLKDISDYKEYIKPALATMSQWNALKSKLQNEVVHVHTQKTDGLVTFTGPTVSSNDVKPPQKSTSLGKK